MLGARIDLKASLDSGEDLGESSPLGSVGLYISGGLRPFDDLYQKLSSGTSLTDDERDMHEKELFRLFSHFVQADENSVSSMSPGVDEYVQTLEFGSSKAEEKIRAILDNRHSEGSIQRDLADAIMGLREKDESKAIQACKSFIENSANSFVVDLARSDAVVKFEDGRNIKIYQLLGYKTYAEMRDASEAELKNRFVEKFRDLGLSDAAIANLAMNMSQKSTIGGHAYSAALLMQRNEQYTGPEATHRREEIIIDRNKRKVKFSSSSNVTLRLHENPEVSKSALLSSWSFTLPMGEVGDSRKNFDEIFEHSLGYKVTPIDASADILIMPGMVPPKFSGSLVINPLSLDELDNMLPDHKSDGLSLNEVRQTFSELFGIQRGARFSKGVSGRLLDIINEELQYQGHKKVRSIEGAKFTKEQIGKLVEVLAAEQKIDSAEIPKLKAQIIQAVDIRARLDAVGYKEKLDVKIDGPKLNRFGFLGELSRKASQVTSVWRAARDIGESMDQSLQRAREEAARGALTVLPTSRGRRR